MTTLQTSPLRTTSFTSPVGDLTLVASDIGLRAVLWPGDGLRRAGLADADLRRDPDPVLETTGEQLDEYFAGSRTSFELPLDLRGTPFQLQAWSALAEIPYGETRTYSEQAARLRRPSAFRAVGTANGRNPLSIVLPCHRVLGADGALRGFAGGLAVKAALLEHERAVVAAGSGLVPSTSPVALGGESAVP